MVATNIAKYWRNQQPAAVSGFGKSFKIRKRCSNTYKMSHTQQIQAADIVLKSRIGKRVLRPKREDAEVGSKKIEASTGILGLCFLRTARKIGKNGGIAHSLSDCFLSCPFFAPDMLFAYRHLSGIQDTDPGRLQARERGYHTAGR
jgi:hypothetical protein